MTSCEKLNIKQNRIQKSYVITRFPVFGCFNSGGSGGTGGIESSFDFSSPMVIIIVSSFSVEYDPAERVNQ